MQTVVRKGRLLSSYYGITSQRFFSQTSIKFRATASSISFISYY